jgi:uracil-DNA glycosylase
MQVNLSQEWQSILAEEIQKEYFKDLIKSVEEVYQNATCFPPKELIFNAFNACAFDNLKVVIIGQDPYHGDGEANGLCFSVNDGVKIHRHSKIFLLKLIGNTIGYSLLLLAI